MEEIMRTTRILKLISQIVVMISLLLCFSASFSSNVHVVIYCPTKAVDTDYIPIGENDVVFGFTADVPDLGLCGFAYKNSSLIQMGACKIS